MVLDRARSEPRSLVIGIDANAASMAESSRRASRGRLTNAFYVVASAERVPDDLRGVADELTILFPWGSLLRGTLALERAAEAAAGIASLLAPGATATAILSIEDRDGLDLPLLEAAGARQALRERWSRHGVEVCELRPATAEEIAATRSTWARRLAAGRDRTAWRLELRRSTPGPRDAVRPRR